jgi:hypothetical protein
MDSGIRQITVGTKQQRTLRSTGAQPTGNAKQPVLKQLIQDKNIKNIREMPTKNLGRTKLAGNPFF